MRKASGPDPQIGPLLFLRAVRASFSRAGPRGMSKSEGARAPNDRHPSLKFGSLPAPACGALSVRGCNIIVSGPQVHPAAFRAPGFRRSGPLAAALLERRAAPLREGRPCKVLPPMPGLDRLPRNLRRAVLATTLRTESNAALTGPPTLPRFRRSAAASLCRARLRAVWGRFRVRG
jgi:hypothetical protein